MKILIYSPDAPVLKRFNELLWTFSPPVLFRIATIREDECTGSALHRVILSDQHPTGQSL
jgi:hypothetical protein